MYLQIYISLYMHACKRTCERTSKVHAYIIHCTISLILIYVGLYICITCQAIYITPMDSTQLLPTCTGGYASVVAKINAHTYKYMIHVIHVCIHVYVYVQVTIVVNLTLYTILSFQYFGSFDTTKCIVLQKVLSI